MLAAKNTIWFCPTGGEWPRADLSAVAVAKAARRLESRTGSRLLVFFVAKND